MNIFLSFLPLHHICVHLNSPRLLSLCINMLKSVILFLFLIVGVLNLFLVCPGSKEVDYPIALVDLAMIQSDQSERGIFQ